MPKKKCSGFFEGGEIVHCFFSTTVDCGKASAKREGKCTWCDLDLMNYMCSTAQLRGSLAHQLEKMYALNSKTFGQACLRIPVEWRDELASKAAGRLIGEIVPPMLISAEATAGNITYITQLMLV